MSTYVPAALRRRIRARFVDRCADCRTAEALIAAIFEIEHIIPRCAGGETVFDNLCLAYPTCNRYKASRQTAVAPVLGHTVPLFHSPAITSDNQPDARRPVRDCARVG
jgi:5-methylcytosine-specific restriction endonuclease McrA